MVQHLYATVQHYHADCDVIVYDVHFRQDKPSREEKCDMPKSVCDTFPILKDPVTGGYVSSTHYYYVADDFVTHL